MRITLLSWLLPVSLSSLFVYVSGDGEINIESFDDPSHTWTSLNDPVMGGKSTGSVEINGDEGVAIFDGEVVDVPFLHAPGFIQMVTRGGSYPDVSICTALQMNLMATKEYKGYRISFGNVHLPDGRFAMGYKADFDAPIGEYSNVVIPFHAFSSKWDDATGDQIVTCRDGPQYCPDEDTLKNMQTLAIWGEGVAGDVRLRIKSISAIGCSGGGLVRTAGSNSDEESNHNNSLVFMGLVAFATSLLLSFVLKLRKEEGTAYLEVQK